MRHLSNGIERRNLPDRMHAGVGTACHSDATGLGAEDCRCCVFQYALNCAGVELKLRTAKIGAVVLYD